MQVVIDIDDDIARGIINEQGDAPRNIVRSFQATIADAIKNGTPLPKGHGRLGDLDALETEMVNGICAGNYEEGYEKFPHINDIDDCVECIRYSDTIIEADKE